MQDLINTERRSVRNISIDKPKVMASEESTSTDVADHDTSTQSSTMTRPQPPYGTIGRSKTAKKWWWIGGGALALLIILIVIGSIFTGATVTITPRQTAVNLDGTLTAYRDPLPGDIGFEVVTVSKEASRIVKATGSEQIDRPASGTIVIYNDFSEETQKLIVNTRFQTPEGLVYRIQESVTVPGKNTDGTPGSIEAKVFADETGESHNIGLSDFTIPGFKEGGDLERFQKFYARSKTPMTGGFSGTVPVASEADTDAAVTALEAELTEALATDAGTSLPEGFVVIPDSGSYTFETLPNEAGADSGSVVITVRGESHLLAVNSTDVARDAASERIQGYTGEPVAFVDPTTLSFSIVDASTDIVSATSTQIRVSGLSTLVWTFDTDDLASRLAGISRADTDEVFRDYQGIERADVVVKPFWKRSLPDTIEEITIEVESAVQ